MKCTVNDLNLSFDKDNRLRATIGKVTGWNINKAYALASFLQNDKFKKYLSERLLPDDILKDTSVDINNIKEEDYVNIKQNKLGSLLNAFYLDTYHSVDNSKTSKAMSRLNGFTSSTAKKLAKDYTADAIIDKYAKELNKPSNKSKDVRRKEIIAEVVTDINNTFLDRASDFALNVIGTDKYSKEAKEYANKLLELIKKINSLNEEIKSSRNWLIATQKTLNTKRNNKLTKEEKEYLNKQFEEFKKADAKHQLNRKVLAQLNRDRYVMSQNLINLYTNNLDGTLRDRLRNFANLASQINGDSNAFFFEVFNTQRMTNLAKEFNKVGDIEEYLENEDTNTGDIDIQYNGETVDETAKSWEDNLYKNFNQTISTRMKMILSRLPKLSSPYNETTENQAVDTNNELGVPVYMDTQFLTVQIYSFGDFSNVESLINSLEIKSKNIKAVYGLGELVARMKQDRVLANYVYTNFAKPIVNKTMATITNINAEDGITFDYSNPNAFYTTKLVFDMMNKLRATYNSTYDSKDISTLKESLSKLNKTKEEKEEGKRKIHEIIAKYFPNFDMDSLNNIIDNESNKEVINDLLNAFSEIIKNVGKLKQDINNKLDKINNDFQEAKKKYEDKFRLAILENTTRDFKEPYPKKGEFDLSEYELTPAINRGIIKFANIIAKYNESRARLNTSNAAGNTASDVIKNSFITRFFEQILAESEEDSNAGLQQLGKYLMQGTEGDRDNQYSNNPIFFGLKDENGVIKVPGMFTRVGDNFIINKNAKDILKYSLFDGAKNVNSGMAAVYEQMSKLDFFVTQYVAFSSSVSEMTENGPNKKIGNLDSAVYPMRIGSDAPKIFMIRAPRYNNSQLELAFYNHLMNEFNMFTQAINNLFVQEGDVFKTKTSITGLFGRAYFDERTAAKLREKGKTDFTSAIVKDGKLVGNMFKFQRLFELGNYNAEADIQSLLSLYGEGNTGLFVKSDKGRLMLNPEYFNDNSFLKIANDRIILDFSSEHKAALKNIVRKWMDAYMQEANVRLQDYINALKQQGFKYNDTIIRSFLLNTANMNMNYDDLFEGDYKYYVGSRDFLKRTKETQAGGESYENTNVLDDTQSIKELTFMGSPAYIKIKQKITEKPNHYSTPTNKNGRIEETSPMIARNGWRAVTIYNTITPADFAQDLQNELEDIFIRQGLNKKYAHERAVKIAAGYFSNTKVNDAQSYITLEEFIRRKDADGTLDEYQDLIAQLLDPDVKAEDINLDEINARIQVQKNFYYDKVFDPDTNQFYPRQIKNAEFVLIPKLLPQDSDLRRIYEWMRKNDIGQLNTAETDKAAKKNIFTIFDEKTGKLHEDFEEQFRPEYVQNYYYQYLYKQQDVPQHMTNEENKFGAQISKKILDNVSTASEEVKQLADEYQNAFAANIREDFYRFLDNMGWEIDHVTGKIVNSNYVTTDMNGQPLPPNVIEDNRTKLNLQNYYARAREEAARLGMDSNFMEYLIPDEFGNPKMPNYMNTVMSKLESVAQSMFNRSITRQVMPGWHAAQITGVGYSKKLNFDPKTGVMEVYLPRWSNMIPKGKTPEEDAKILAQIQREGLDIHIGYRIPTEGKQSISVLKVVGFTNDALGSTIVVPDAWVTQTGSDFDVDSIYGICWEMYKKTNKDGTISLHKIPFEEDTINEESLYIQYVNRSIEDRINRTDLKDEINNKVKQIRDSFRAQTKEEYAKNNTQFKEVDAERNKLFKQLPPWARGIIKDDNKEATTKERKDKIAINLIDLYDKINTDLTNYLDSHKVSEAQIEVVNQYMDYQTALISIMREQEGIIGFDKEAYRSKKSEEIAAIVEKAKVEHFKLVQDKAKETGLMSYEEFEKQDFVDRLSRKARNNYILDRMIKIMNDESSREEQYGRSQFEGITNSDGTGANNIINALSGSTSKPISPYNPLDQLDYFDDAMSGARLKAMSVNWDTFASRCNRMKVQLSDVDAVEVILPVEGISAETSQISYDETTLKDAYDEDIEEYEDSAKLKPAKEKSIFVAELVDTKINISERRLSELKPLIEEAWNDTKGIYIPWGEFRRFAYNKKYYGKYNDGKEYYLEYKATEQIQDFVIDNDIFKVKDTYKKGYVAITKGLYNLLQNTTPDEFFALMFAELDDVLKYINGDFKGKAKEKILDNNIINSFIDRYNNPSDEELLGAINRSFEDTPIAHISRAIEYDRYGTVIISKEVIDNEEIKSKYPKSYARLVELYNQQNGITDIKPTTSKKVKLTARKFGWSKNNKNIVGDYVTTYTSQTTAHHLDAVKEGSIPNVNEYTFAVYKFLTCIGLDHEFSVGFMRQPIISRLVANYNLTNSVFFKSNHNPIEMTIADLASDLGLRTRTKSGKEYPITHDSSLYFVLDALKENTEFVTAFENIFGINLKEMDNLSIMTLKFPLRKDYIFQRIKTAGINSRININRNDKNAYNQAAVDFAMLLNFKQFQYTTKKIETLQRIANTDKVGAKPNIRETRSLVELVKDYRGDLTLQKDGTSFVDLIYPTVNPNSEEVDVNNSLYKSAAAAYAYATMRSVETNTQIFITENDDFADAEKEVNSRIGRRLKEQEYKEYKRYALAYMYNKLNKLLTPITVDDRGRIIPFIDNINESENELKTAKNYWDVERSRIVGYGIVTESNFKCVNINNPTAEEIKEYIKLTPAQKVLFIQRNFSDKQGIFNYLKVTLINNTDAKYKGITRQYLAYDEQIDSIEDLYEEFINSFSNKNPLIKLAAIDLIKYAFIAEGFNFRSGYVSKIIPNSVLYTAEEQGGMDIIDQANTLIRELPTDIRSQEFIDMFIRSHSELADVYNLGEMPPMEYNPDSDSNIPKYDNKASMFKKLTHFDGLVVINATLENDIIQSLVNRLKLKRHNGGYIKVTFPGKDNKTPITRLYRVEGRNETKDGFKDYYLIPLNLLDKYETYDISYNQNYNEFNEISYYEHRIEELAIKTESYRSSDTTIKKADSLAKNDVKAVKQPIGNYSPSTGNETWADDSIALEKMTDSNDYYLAGGVKLLLNDIKEVIIPRVLSGDYTATYIANQNPKLATLIPEKSFVTQTIFDKNGNAYNVTIAHIGFTPKIINKINKILNGEVSDKELNKAVDNIRRFEIRPTSAKLYRVSIVQTKKEVEDNVKFASTELITDETEVIATTVDNSARRGRSIDNVSASIIKQITYDARKNESTIALQFVRDMNKRGVNRNFRSSLIEHKSEIYKAAARYYKSAANSIINALNKYEIDRVEYDMGSEEMYEALAKNDEHFAEVAHIILDAVTFGNRIEAILSLDLTAEDKDTKDAIESICNSIKSIRNNAKVRTAMNNLINIYFKKYSTNPMITEGLMNIRDQFGDIDTVVKLIADPAEINNSEVQVILKQIYAMFNKAEMFDTERNVKEWKDALADIEAMSETIDMSKIIDNERGMLRQDFNNAYLEERARIFNELQDAKEHKFDSIANYGKYLKAKYARDRFMYEHTEQPILGEYYEEDLAIRKQAMDRGGDAYIEYMMLSAKLYELNGNEGTDEELANEKKRIKNRMRQLTSEVYEDGSEKAPEIAAKAKAITEFINARRNINKKYFNTQEYDGFQEDYQRYSSFIKSYNAIHSTETLEEKLENVEYREAYEWIKNNGVLGFSDEAGKKLNDAFKALTGRTTSLSKKTMRNLRSIEGVIDDSGQIDARKLTSEQIAQLKQEQEQEYADKYGNPYGDSFLIKEVPETPILSYKKKEEKLNETKYKNNAKKYQLITKINNILIKAVNIDTGHIDINTLFNDKYVTDAEREELGRLYKELRELRTVKVRRFKRRNKAFTGAINDSAYLTAKNFYDKLPKNSKLAKQWIEIFTEETDDGNIGPNSLIYGYYIPEPEFVDEEKTEALDFIKKNVNFAETEYYYLAMNKAKEEGNYDEWFEANHVYNPITRRMEPLKIWTTVEAKPDSELAKSITYIPSFDNVEKSIKPEYVNPKYNEFSNNYKRGDSKYDTAITLNKKERALKELIQKTLNKYATTYQGKRFVGAGYLPRERSAQINGKWALGQIAAILGASWHSNADSDAFNDTVDYSHDRYADMKMLQLLKGKGSKAYKKLPNRADFNSDAEYKKELDKVREENKKIAEENLKIDNADLNRNWLQVMEDFVYNATIFNSRQAAKPYLYLLLEDLAVNNAYMIKGMWNKSLVKDLDSSTKDDTQYRMVAQNNTRELVHNLARRLLYGQYHENNVPRTVANFLQNLTSAKYMVFNVYGGIANVTTGLTNIAMEEYANEYFGFADFHNAEKRYLSNSFSFIGSMYTDKAPNITVALCKHFHVVNFDDMLQFAATSKDLDSRIKEVRNLMYGFQSMGEHFMQNSVLLAMLNSNRLYTDGDGVKRIGDFKDYTWNIEQRAMQEVLIHNQELLTNYNLYRKSIGEYNISDRLDVSTGRKDINRNFLFSLRNSTQGGEELYKKIAKAYHAKREELMKTAMTEFKNNPTVESLYEFKNGKVNVKEEAYNNFKGNTPNPIGDLDHLLGEFKEKVKLVNKKIHGVYDKDGAAFIESKWWGSLVMQYHKHLPTGIWKRWRRKGYYSEFRGSMERGSYQQVIDFLGTEFTDFKTRIGKKQENGTNIALASIQVTMESAINTLVNIQFNWNNLSNWEKANMRRNLGDITGVLAACLVVIALYGLWDDDDIKDDTFKASCLYLADRLYADSTMYSPVGLISEYKTAWSSPIASANGPSDLIKAITMIPKALFDPEFNPKYETGLYKGKNKFEVLFRRNLPGIRPYDRIQNITRNNNYYKIDNSQIGISIAKSFGEMLYEQ